MLADSAVYSVVAENKAGQDQTNGRLDIVKDSSVDDKPIVDPAAFKYIQAAPPEGFAPADLKRAAAPVARTG